VNRSCTFLLLLCTLPLFAQTDVPTAPAAKTGDETKALIGAVYDRNEIPSLTVPYHFLATFKTFKADGQPDGDGSIERWAVPGKRMKTVTRFRDHSVTEYRNDDASSDVAGRDTTRYTDDGFDGSIMLYFANLSLLRAAFRPEAIQQRTFEPRAIALQGDVLDCGMFAIEIGPAGYPAPPKENFCVSRDTGNLVMRQTGGLSIRFRDFAPFLDKSIARTISASKGPQVRFRIKIEQLDQATLEQAAMTPPADASPTSPEPSPWATQPGETTPAQTTKVPAPPELKASHATGPVVLYVLISRTGAVTDVEPIIAASPALADYAAQVVRGYKYMPIVRQGKPLEEIARAYFNFKF
jgi:hypothetical protein